MSTGETEGKGARFGRGAETAERGVEALGQRRQVGRDERGGLRSEPAERTMVVAVAARGDGLALVVCLHANRGRSSERRLQLGCDRRDVGGRLRRDRRDQRLMIGDGDELDGERDNGDHGGERRTERRETGPSPPPPPLWLACAFHHFRPSLPKLLPASAKLVAIKPEIARMARASRRIIVVSLRGRG